MKFLIIRLSSFGDIIQCLSVVDSILRTYPDAQIDWVVRSDLKNVLKLSSRINQVWSFDREEGFTGLVDLSKKLKSQRYDYVYDAHCNLRSEIMKMLIAPFWKIYPRVITRSKKRFKRFLLFKLGINLFPSPYRGMISYQTPLKRWRISPSTQYMHGAVVPKEALEKVQQILRDRFENGRKVIVLAPSAAWEMKRWPIEHWKRLIRILPGYNYVLLGGPQDRFCEELESDNVYNLAGKLSLIESCAMVKQGYITISADTGLLHVADYLGVAGIALIGPTAFGFPTGKHIETIDVPLKCRPCSKDGRGRCSQDIFQKCLVDLTPERVANCVRNYELS